MSDEFLRGYACAIAGLVRHYDQPTMAFQIARNDGISLSDFEGIRLPFDDHKVLLRIWKAEAGDRDE